MHNTIRTACLLCDDAVDIIASEVVLHLAGPAMDAPNRYGFSCPACAVFVVRPADEGVVDLLLTGGVELSTGATPPWETEQRRPSVLLVDTGPHPEGVRWPDADAFVEADVQRFADQLADDATIVRWLEL